MLPTRLPHETQVSIEAWADQTFGPATGTTLPRILARANEEMAELVRSAVIGASPDEIAEEAADVVIVLCRPAAMTGADLTPVMGLTTPAGVSPARSATNAAGLLSFLLEAVVEGGKPSRQAGIYVSLIATRLAELVAGLGRNLADEIAAKMVVNRTRTWIADGTGCAYHEQRVAV